MNVKDYRIKCESFHEGDRVLWIEEDGRERYGNVEELDGPNPMVLFDGAAVAIPCATEDLWLTAGNYPGEG